MDDVCLTYVRRDDYPSKYRFRLYFTIRDTPEIRNAVHTLFHNDTRLYFVGNWHTENPLGNTVRLYWRTNSEEAVVEYTLRYG